MQRPPPTTPGRFGLAIVASLLLHVAIAAAAASFNWRDQPTLPPTTAIGVEIISMAPDPGGQPNAGLSAGGSAPQALATHAGANGAPGEPATSGAADQSVAAKPPPTPAALRLDEAAAETVASMAVVFRVPSDRPTPPQPRTPQPPTPTAEAPAPGKPLASPQPVDTTPPAAPSVPARDFALASQLAAIGTPVPGEARGMPGVGSGVAGARKGPRFQLGAPGNPLPEYPERARRRGHEGRVVLAVTVTATGEPVSVEVADSSGYPLLDRAALRAVRRWRFHPAAGIDPRELSQVKVPITFRLED